MTKLEKTLIEVKSEIRRQEQNIKDDKPNATNHILHLLLSIVTAGMWIPVWILIALSKVTFSFGGAKRELEELYKIHDEITTRIGVRYEIK